MLIYKFYGTSYHTKIQSVSSGYEGKHSNNIDNSFDFVSDTEISNTTVYADKLNLLNNETRTLVQKVVSVEFPHFANHTPAADGVIAKIPLADLGFSSSVDIVGITLIGLQNLVVNGNRNISLVAGDEFCSIRVKETNTDFVITESVNGLIVDGYFVVRLPAEVAKSKTAKFATNFLFHYYN